MMRGFYGAVPRGQGFCASCLNGGFFASPWVMGIAALIGAALVALVIVLIVKAAKRRAEDSSETVALLKEKYVSGEITEEEYLRKRKVIK